MLYPGSSSQLGNGTSGIAMCCGCWLGGVLFRCASGYMDLVSYLSLNTCAERAEEAVKAADIQ